MTLNNLVSMPQVLSALNRMILRADIQLIATIRGPNPEIESARFKMSIRDDIIRLLKDHDLTLESFQACLNTMSERDDYHQLLTNTNQYLRIDEYITL